MEIENSPRRAISHSSFEFHHSGFTFIEVLFAVILLGIGFIMIAAVFPVAIQQTSAVSDETQGTALGRDAIKTIQAIADQVGANALFPTTVNGGVPSIMAFSYNLTQAVGTNAFFSVDRRFAWVGFYRRDSATSPFAQVSIIALQNPNFANYSTPYYWTVASPPVLTLISGASLTQPAVPPWAVVPPPIPPNAYNASPPAPGLSGYFFPSSDNRTPVPASGTDPKSIPIIPADYYQDASHEIKAILYYDPASTNATVTFFSGTGASTPPNAVTGACLLVANDNFAAPYAGFLNGRFFRLGGQTTTPLAVATSGTYSANPGLTFLLQPGSDYLNDLYNISVTNVGTAPQEPWGGGGSNSGSGIEFFLMGAAPTLNNPTPAYSNDFTGPFSGPNQDIGVATGFIRVNTTNN